MKASSLVASAIVRPFDIGPRIPGLVLAGRDLRISMKVSMRKIFGRAERLGEIDQLGERETGPGDRHAPGFHAAVAVGALLQRHLADQFVDADLERLFHHAVDLHRPRPDRQFLRLVGDFLGRIEFVEIIVVRVDLLVGDRPVERVFRVALGRIEIGGRVRQIGQIGDALRSAAPGASAKAARAAQQQTAAVEEQMLGRGETFGISQPRRRMTCMG